MESDSELLRRYAGEGLEAAFAELVRRYLDLVYSAALRRVGGDAHRARDVAQVVFTTLARKAGALTGHPVLVGWLYTTTQHAAAKAVRTELRRQTREQEAHAMMNDNPASEDTTIDWEQVRPVLDDALRELGERDREAVLLRYFAQRPFAEIGAALKVSEDAARMRVERALVRLQALLVRRGIVSTSTAVSAALAQQGGGRAPVGLIESVLKNIQSSAAATAVQPSVFWKMIVNPKILMPLAAVVVVGFAISRPRAQTPPAQSALSSPADRSTGSAEPPSQNHTSMAPPGVVSRAGKLSAAKKGFPAEIMQEQAIRNQLRQIGAARDAFLKFENRLPESLADIVGPTKMIRELKSVNGEDYATVKLDSKILSVELPGGSTVTLTTEGPQRRGPPMREETATWKSALASYLQSRPAGTGPRLSGKQPAPKRKGDVEFAGLMASGANHVFIVEDQNGATQWVKLGQRVGPYVVSEYRAGDETLILKNGDAVMPLNLRKTKPTLPALQIELEIAFLALREVLTREGWSASDMSIQKPQPMHGGRWFVGMYRIAEKNEQRIVPGEQIRVVLAEDGAIESYENAGVRRPREN